MPQPDQSLAGVVRLQRAMLQHAPVGAGIDHDLQGVVLTSVSQTGKLVRGRLLQAAAATLAVDEETADALAVATEYFHLASLLLDDLPCMDDALTRRGQPCAHHLHGEAATILAALAFINRAHALIGFALAPWPGRSRCQVHAALDACLGVAGLVGGQARDLGFARVAPTPRAVAMIALAKTSPLLWLALLLPAVAGGASAREIAHLKALAVYWGLAFQALDDLRDLLATSVEAGKTTGRDRTLARPNLGLVLGVPATRQRLHRLITQAEHRIGRLVGLRSGWTCLHLFHQEFAQAAAPAASPASEAAA
jgi:geranylgeranyl diphosphate synthase, type II